METVLHEIILTYDWASIYGDFDGGCWFKVIFFSGKILPAFVRVGEFCSSFTILWLDKCVYGLCEWEFVLMDSLEGCQKNFGVHLLYNENYLYKWYLEHETWVCLTGWKHKLNICTEDWKEQQVQQIKNHCCCFNFRNWCVSGRIWVSSNQITIPRRSCMLLAL